MKKTLIILILLIFSASIYAQSKDYLLTKTNLFKNFNFDLNTNDYTLDVKNIDLYKNSLLLSSYNKTTELNDIYLLNNANSIYSK